MDTAILKERAFLKLSAKCGLDKWEVAGSVLLELFNVLMQVLSPADSSFAAFSQISNCPAGGTDLSPGSSRAGSGP